MSPVSIRDLAERRVPQYLAVYLGASWGLIQFIDFIATHYGLSPHWTDLTLLTLGLLLPSVVLYTYHHGRPGKDEWQKIEKIFIPANVLLLALVLLSVGSTTNLSALTTRVQVKDDKGNTVERLVVNQAYRKRVLMFSFDPQADTQKWLSLAAPVLASIHLQQQQFIQPVSSVDVQPRLAQAGYDEGINVPLTLKRQIADEQHILYFVTGTVRQTASGVTAQVRLYETATAKLMAEHTYTAPSVAGVADMISEHLVRDLNIPSLGDAQPQMSVADIVTQNPAALKACFEAIEAVALRNDYPTANAHIAEAVRLDPTSAYAQLVRYLVASASNQQPQALAAIQAALDRSYRLPERLQQMVKAEYYDARQDYPRAFAALDMLSQLYPEDIQVLLQKVQVSKVRDDKPMMIATYQKILELDPSRAELLLELGNVYQAQGDATNALEQYQKYARRFPTDEKAFKTIADLYTRIGDHAKARAAYEQALLLKPEDVGTLVAFADLEMHLGNFEATQQKLQDAMAAAKTPQDKAVVLGGISSLQDMTGQIAKSLATRQQVLVESAKFQAPAMLVWLQFMYASKAAKLDPKKAEMQVNVLKQKLGPMFSMFAPIADAGIYYEMQDAAREEQTAAALDSVIKKTSFVLFRPIALQAHGRALELRGDCAAALQWYKQLLALDPLDVETQGDIGRCYRKLNEFAQAQKALSGVLKVVPSQGDANLEMALLYKQAGDVERSRQFAAIAMRTWQNADAGYKPAQQARGLM